MLEDDLLATDRAGAAWSGKPTSPRLAVADDQPIYRAGLRVAVSASPTLRLVGEVTSIGELIAICRARAPDVILLASSLTNDAASLRPLLRSCAPVARLVLLVAVTDDDALAQAVVAGATAVVDRSVSAEQLVETLQRVAAGEVFLNTGVLARPGVALAVLDALRRSAWVEAAPAPESPLSERESEVLARVATGHTNREVGHQLGISETTVKHHMTKIIDKTGSRDRTHAVVVGLQRGWIAVAGLPRPAPDDPPAA